MALLSGLCFGVGAVGQEDGVGDSGGGRVGAAGVDGGGDPGPGEHLDGGAPGGFGQSVGVAADVESSSGSTRTAQSPMSSAGRMNGLYHS